MKLIDRLRQDLERVGATLDAGDYALNCDAPSGYVWVSNDCAALAIPYATNSQTWLSQALREEMPRLRMGLRKITDPAELAECRWNLGDDNWGAPSDAPERIPFTR